MIILDEMKLFLNRVVPLSVTFAKPAGPPPFLPLEELFPSFLLRPYCQSVHTERSSDLTTQARYSEWRATYLYAMLVASERETVIPVATNTKSSIRAVQRYAELLKTQNHF